MSRKTSTPEKEAFLTALQARPSVYHAAIAAGISRRTAYELRGADDTFQQAWDDALKGHADLLEMSAYERALAGDTVLTIFLLKGMKPNVYRDNVRVAHTGPDGGPVEVRNVEGAETALASRLVAILDRTATPAAANGHSNGNS